MTNQESHWHEYCLEEEDNLLIQWNIKSSLNQENTEDIELC